MVLPAAPPPPAVGSYMTVKEPLKSILDRAEKTENAKDKPILISLVAAKDSKLATIFTALLSERMSFGPLTPIINGRLSVLSEQFKDVDLIGLSLIALNEERASATLLLEGKTDTGAKKLGTLLSELVQQFAPVLSSEMLKLDITFVNANGEPIRPTGGTPPPGSPPFPGTGGLTPPSGGFPPGTTPGVGQPGTPPEAPKPDGTISITLLDKTLQVNVEVSLKEFAFNKIMQQLKQQMIQLKGSASLVDSRPQIHELAAARKEVHRRQETVSARHCVPCSRRKPSY